MLLFLSLLLASPCLASPLLQEAFGSYVKVKKIEEQLALQPSRENQIALTDAKLDFQGIARDQGLVGWEKSVLDHIGKSKEKAPLDPAALTYLQQAFPEPKTLSPLQWQVIREWFGTATQEDFLRQSFQMQELPNPPTSAPPRLVWVLDPFRKLRAEKSEFDPREAPQLYGKAEILELSPFPRVEDQAEELKQLLTQKQSSPFVLVSSGEASAIVFKLLDLYPALRQQPEILGWVNVNGRLFGRTPEASRSLASVAVAQTQAENFAQEALRGMKLLRLERHDRITSLGEGFPILNLLSLEQKFRPTQDLREALVTDGTTRYVNKGDARKMVNRAWVTIAK